MLVQYIAERMNQDTQAETSEIIGGMYDFLYSPDNKCNLEAMLMAYKDDVEVTEYNGFKLYHNKRLTGCLKNTFMVKSPNGRVFFFSVYYHNTHIDCEFVQTYLKQY